nr:uncharacterized protein LOC106026778 [Cavia porcellus]
MSDTTVRDLTLIQCLISAGRSASQCSLVPRGAEGRAPHPGPGLLPQRAPVPRARATVAGVGTARRSGALRGGGGAHRAGLLQEFRRARSKAQGRPDKVTPSWACNYPVSVEIHGPVPTAQRAGAAALPRLELQRVSPAGVPVTIRWVFPPQKKEPLKEKEKPFVLSFLCCILVENVSNLSTDRRGVANGGGHTSNEWHAYSAPGRTLEILFHLTNECNINSIHSYCSASGIPILVISYLLALRNDYNIDREEANKVHDTLHDFNQHLQPLYLSDRSDFTIN